MDGEDTSPHDAPPAPAPAVDPAPSAGTPPRPSPPGPSSPLPSAGDLPTRAPAVHPTYRLLQVASSLGVVMALVFLGHLVKSHVQRRPGELLPPLPPGPPATGPRLLTLPRDSAKLSLVKTALVTREAIPFQVRLPARIQVNGEALVRLNPPVSGRIVDVRVRAGQSVEKGETLFVVDSPDVGAALSDLAKAMADLEVLKKNAVRAKDLYEKQVIAGQEADAAQADLAKGEAETTRARRRVEQLGLPRDTEGQRIPVRAPFSGTIIDRPANLGEEMRNDSGLQSVLATLADLSTVWVVGDLYESALASAPELAVFSKEHPKLPVSVEVPALGNAKYAGNLDYMSDTVDPQTVTIRLRSTIANPERRLRPEMAALMVITVDKERVGTVVPEKALLVAGGRDLVIVQVNTGVFERREVTVGRRGAGFAAIEDGLREGERVVVEGALFLNGELEAARN